jgi:hypothetical protein
MVIGTVDEEDSRGRFPECLGGGQARETSAYNYDA